MLLATVFGMVCLHLRLVANSDAPYNASSIEVHFCSVALFSQFAIRGESQGTDLHSALILPSPLEQWERPERSTAINIGF